MRRRQRSQERRSGLIAGPLSIQHFAMLAGGGLDISSARAGLQKAKDAIDARYPNARIVIRR